MGLQAVEFPTFQLMARILLRRVREISWKKEGSMPGLMWPHLRHPREVGAMVEAQASRWTLKQHERWEPMAGTWPVVTISCEVGDQGPALGRSLAESLGFSYWDRPLVVELARLLKADSATSVLLDERAHDAVETFLGNSLVSQRLMSADYSDRIRLVVESLSRRGGAVIVGRGAEILVGTRHALRVCLVAPLELGPPGKEPAASADFDVLVNSGTYERERAASLVLMAYLAKFGDWPMTPHSLLHGYGTGPGPVLPPRISPGLVDEGTVQHDGDVHELGQDGGEPPGLSVKSP